MKKRLLSGLAAILLIVSATVVLWQGSFTFSIHPDDPEQTFLFFALSLVIFLVMVALGFMLVRIVIKTWIGRRGIDRLGSRIRTTLVSAALLLSVMPLVFFVLFN